MPKQDPRVVGDALECVEMFFMCVAANSYDQITEFLELAPSLAYARDERGNTALWYAVVSRKEASFKTARILMEHGAEPGAKNEEGEGPYYALSLIDDSRIQREMGRIIGVHFKDYSELEAAIARGERLLNTPEARQIRENSKKEAEDKVDKKEEGSCTILNLHKITYDQDLQKIFKNFQLKNFDQEKALVQESFKLTSSGLESVSISTLWNFEPISSGNLPIIIMPKELVELGLEQFNNLIGKLYEYCLGLESYE